MDDESPKQRVEELIGGLLAKQLTTFFAAAGSRSKTPEWLADRPLCPFQQFLDDRAQTATSAA
jgi:hypothetical protein